MKGYARALAVVLAGVCGAGLQAGSHHFITEVYDVNRTATIEGRVDRFVYQDPHSFVHLQVRDRRGRPLTWAVELEGAASLRQRGVSSRTLRPGDRLTVCGNPGRDAGQYRLLMLALERPLDGLAVRRVAEQRQPDCTS